MLVANIFGVFENIKISQSQNITNCENITIWQIFNFEILLEESGDYQQLGLIVLQYYLMLHG